jgi:hypothetical protein
MGTEHVTHKIANQLQHVLADISHNLDRVEILTAALAGFSRPVPDYEPRFHHLHGATLRDHELRRAGREH